MPTTLAAATPFPIPPDGESTVTLSRAWLTNVQSTESGAEVRAGLRSVPRRTLTYTALFENAQLAGQFKALWANATERLRFLVPLWPRYAVPEAFPDTSTISGDFADRGFVAGDGMAMLWQSETEFELLDVETVADDELTLSTPIAGDFALGAVRVLPVMPAWLEPPTLAQLTVEAEQLPVTFTEELPGIVGIDPDVGAPDTPVVDSLMARRIVESSPWGPRSRSASASRRSMRRACRSPSQRSRGRSRRTSTTTTSRPSPATAPCSRSPSRATRSRRSR
jgi:hypothetical protein